MGNLISLANGQPTKAGENEWWECRIECSVCVCVCVCARTHNQFLVFAIIPLFGRSGYHRYSQKICTLSEFDHQLHSVLCGKFKGGDSQKFTSPISIMEVKGLQRKSGTRRH